MSEEDVRRQDIDDVSLTLLQHQSSWPFVNAQPDRLGVAVSGGSDSMALLDLMISQGREKGFDVCAVTVDHRLRSEARDECAFVGEFCRSRGIEHSVLDWNDWDGAGNLQAKARKARYGLISEWAKRDGVDWIALGHTQNDQAETVLMRLARRSGVDGLAGMPSQFGRQGLKFIRPLLNNAREELRDYLRYQDITWCDDPSNDDDSFERVRVRKVAGVLAELGIDVDTLNSVAWHARSAKSALNHYLRFEVAENNLVEEDRGDLILPEITPTLDHHAPTEIHRRAMNKAILWIAGSDYPPRAMALVQMSANMTDADRHTLGGCVISRIQGARLSQRKLRISREYNAVKDRVTKTDELWDSRWALDGPHDQSLVIRSLGEAVKDCPDWRESGLPRTSLLSSPAIWCADELIAAPLAGFSNGWTAKATGRGNFAEFLISR